MHKSQCLKLYVSEINCQKTPKNNSGKELKKRKKDREQWSHPNGEVEDPSLYSPQKQQLCKNSRVMDTQYKKKK